MEKYSCKLRKQKSKTLKYYLQRVKIKKYNILKKEIEKYWRKNNQCIYKNNKDKYCHQTEWVLKYGSARKVFIDVSKNYIAHKEVIFAITELLWYLKNKNICLIIRTYIIAKAIYVILLRCLCTSKKQPLKTQLPF